MYRLAQGSTRYNLSKRELVKCRLTLPPIVEQSRIAELLSGDDASLDMLDEYRDHLQQQKKGLMQRLLTGEIRVAV